MKSCFYCNRPIANGTKIIYNGIKYVCKNDEDIQICDNVKNNKMKENTRQSMNIPNLQYETNSLIHCSCGTSFYTYYPIETYPPCDDCPNCHTTHYKK